MKADERSMQQPLLWPSEAAVWGVCMCVLIDLFMLLGCEGAAILSSFSEKQERKDISRNLVAIKAQSVFGLFF